MGRTIVGRTFRVDCKCDRCGEQDSRPSDGDIKAPKGWKYAFICEHTNPREPPLLCPSCVAVVVQAAAPAEILCEEWPDKA